MDINYTSWGLGNNFKDVIELNENLKDYPALHSAVLKHELAHTSKLFSKDDLVLDLTENKINRMELLKFMIKHPKSFSQLLPFYWSRKWGFVYDVNMIIVYLVLLSCLGIGFYLSSLI